LRSVSRKREPSGSCGLTGEVERHKRLHREARHEARGHEQRARRFETALLLIRDFCADTPAVNRPGSPQDIRALLRGVLDQVGALALDGLVRGAAGREEG